jgi:HEAT repeat protein
MGRLAPICVASRLDAGRVLDGDKPGAGKPRRSLQTSTMAHCRTYRALCVAALSTSAFVVAVFFVAAVAWPKWAEYWEIESLVRGLGAAEDAIPWITLRELVQRGEPAVRPVVRVLRGSDTDARCRAALVLGAMGPAAGSAVPALSAALADSSDQVRERVAYALGRIGPAAGSAVPTLRIALSDPVSVVRLNAAESLWGIDRHAHLLVPVLAELLGDADERLRLRSAYLLGRMGSDARPATAALAAALDDRWSQMGTQSAHTLVQIGRPALPSLTETVNTGSARARALAVYALGEIAEPTDRVLAVLRMAALDDDPWVRNAADRAISRMPHEPAVAGVR